MRAAAWAARHGSQTTVCDGYQVWDRLSASTRELFFSQDIVYARRIEEQKWRALAAHLLRGVKAAEGITVDDLVGLARSLGGDLMQVTPNDDGSIFYAYRTGAVHPTLFGGRPAFANSILGPAYHYEKPRITLADGSAIPEQVLAEIRQVSDSLTQDIDWQDGDVAIVDNTRVMHGRRAITDPERRSIFVALSFVDTPSQPVVAAG